MRRRTALFFVAPALVLFAVFILYPMFTMFSYSVFTWAGTSRGAFVGIDNFVALFTRAPFTTDLPRAVSHNVLFFIGLMVVQNTFGLTIAYLLQSRPRIRRALQTIYAMPYLIGPIVVGYLWSLLLSPVFGPLNTVLREVGLDALAIPWLGEPKTALWVVVIVSAWQWIGFPVLLYGAALGGIPAELAEAARIDGATNRQAFFRVTLPLLLPAVGTMSVLTFIFAMEVFALPYAFGGSTGSPAGSIDFVSLLFYRVAFGSGATDAVGHASALAVLLFIVIFGGAYAGTRVLRRYEKRLVG
jgi:raffinose/stachyose/melibiose transport system permease protein